MKKYRGLVAAAMTIMMAVSAYSMVSGAAAQQDKVDELLLKAENCRKQGLYDKAVLYYDEVMEIENKSRYYIEIADMYYDAAQYDAARKWCEETITAFPKEVTAYERMLRVCMKQGDYAEAYSVMDDFDGRKLFSEAMEEYREKLRYLYNTDSVSFDEIRQFSSDYAGVCVKGLWGLAAVKGNNVIRPAFTQIGYYANEMVPVMDKEGIWYMANIEGEYIYNISNSVDGAVSDIGLYSGECIPICVNGSYGFYNLEGSLQFGGYDYAGSFSGGVAAVKKDGLWSLVNREGEPVTEDVYQDIILDERGVCCQKERIFAKVSQEGYILLDASGKRIGSEIYENARLFGGGYAAVMQHGLWGYIGLSGEMMMEPEYEDAKSFYEGAAAVCEKGVWGYIDQEGNYIVEPQYLECLNFSSAGTAFAKEEGGWRIIKFYRSNH